MPCMGARAGALAPVRVHREPKRRARTRRPPAETPVPPVVPGQETGVEQSPPGPYPAPPSRSRPSRRDVRPERIADPLTGPTRRGRASRALQAGALQDPLHPVAGSDQAGPPCERQRPPRLQRDPEPALQPVGPRCAASRPAVVWTCISGESTRSVEGIRQTLGIKEASARQVSRFVQMTCEGPKAWRNHLPGGFRNLIPVAVRECAH